MRRAAQRTRLARLLLGTGLLVLPVGATSCGGGPRNCLIIPAQIELVSERRTAQLKVLESKARQVDRMRSSLERTSKRLVDLRAEKALLDSLDATGN